MISSFDSTHFPFVEYFESHLGPLPAWDSLLERNSYQYLIKEAHNVVNSSQFFDLYLEFLAYIKQVVGEPIYFQKRPTFRVQTFNSKSVDFHTDDLTSGHPLHIRNIWIPLTNVVDSNSIWLVPQDRSALIRSDFYSEQLSLDELNSCCLLHATPNPMSYGQYLTFSNSNFHGTVTSKSPLLRASLDFRILPKSKASPLGVKVLGRDYLDLDDHLSDSISTNAISVVYMNGQARIYSNHIQRQMVYEFAASRNYSIVREIAEWQGVSHFPQVKSTLLDHPSLPVIFSTKACLDLDDPAHVDFLNFLKSSGRQVFFALERESL